MIAQRVYKMQDNSNPYYLRPTKNYIKNQKLPIPDMDITNIISVDPAQKPLGAIHTEITERILRNSNISHGDDLISSRQFFNFVFGTPSRSTLFSSCALLLRTLFAAVLILSGSLILMDEVNAPTTFISPQTFAIGQIIIGGMLFLGFLSRFAMAVGFAGFAFVATKAILAGMLSVSPILLGVICLTFMILGTGRFSCDFLIRKSIILCPAKC